MPFVLILLREACGKFGSEEESSLTLDVTGDNSLLFNDVDHDSVYDAASDSLYTLNASGTKELLIDKGQQHQAWQQAQGRWNLPNIGDGFQMAQWHEFYKYVSLEIGVEANDKSYLASIKKFCTDKSLNWGDVVAQASRIKAQTGREKITAVLIASVVLDTKKNNPSFYADHKEAIDNILKIIASGNLSVKDDSSMGGAYKYLPLANTLKGDFSLQSVTSVNSRAAFMHELCHADQDQKRIVANITTSESEGYLFEGDYITTQPELALAYYMTDEQLGKAIGLTDPNQMQSISAAAIRYKLAVKSNLSAGVIEDYQKKFNLQVASSKPLTLAYQSVTSSLRQINDISTETDLMVEANFKQFEDSIKKAEIENLTQCFIAIRQPKEMFPSQDQRTLAIVNAASRYLNAAYGLYSLNALYEEKITENQLIARFNPFTIDNPIHSKIVTPLIDHGFNEQFIITNDGI